MKTETAAINTMGPVSAPFINALKRGGKTTFTLDDAVTAYGKERSKTILFLSDLVKRNVITRIKSGVYLILDVGFENAQLNNWPIIASHLAGDKPYYLSYYAAMRFHGMTTHALFDITLTMPGRHRAKKVDLITYHFIYSKPAYFWGFRSLWVTKQNKVNVSDLERTLLDGLDRPDLCGGIKEVVRGIWVKQNEIDWKKLAKYARKFHTAAVVKRLGFILEMLELGADIIPQLIKIAASAKGYILLDPDGSKEGKFMDRWHIRINMNIEELKAGVWA
jgi:predicted transcriptional regulator of viral defense system